MLWCLTTLFSSLYITLNHYTVGVAMTRCGQIPVECDRQSGQLSLVQLIQILRSDWLRWARLMRVGQSGIRVEVTGADYAKCNGEYKLIRDWRNPLAPHRPTYKHVSMPRWKYFSLFFKIFHMSRFIYWQRYPHYGWTIGPRRSGQGFFHNSYGMYKNISFLVRKYFKMNKNILLRRSERTEPALRAVAGELEKRNQCGLQTSYEARLYRLSWQWANSHMKNIIVRLDTMLCSILGGSNLKKI